jgi:hypothetical protein
MARRDGHGQAGGAREPDAGSVPGGIEAAVAPPIAYFSESRSACSSSSSSVVWTTVPS